VEDVQFDAHFLYLVVAGQPYRIRWEACSERLQRALPAERGFMHVSPGGYGIHWPLIDEDLAIVPLLQHAEKLDSLPDTLSDRETLIGMN
jgi:hypothetical protein